MADKDGSILFSNHESSLGILKKKKKKQNSAPTVETLNRGHSRYGVTPTVAAFDCICEWHVGGPAVTHRMLAAGYYLTTISYRVAAPFKRRPT